MHRYFRRRRGGEGNIVGFEPTIIETLRFRGEGNWVHRCLLTDLRSVIKPARIVPRASSHPFTNASGERPLTGTDFEYRLSMRMSVPAGLGLLKKNSISNTAAAGWLLRKSP